MAESGGEPVFPTPSSGTPSVEFGGERGAVQLGSSRKRGNRDKQTLNKSTTPFSAFLFRPSCTKLLTVDQPALNVLINNSISSDVNRFDVVLIMVRKCCRSSNVAGFPTLPNRPALSTSFLPSGLMTTVKGIP